MEKTQRMLIAAAFLAIAACPVWAESPPVDSREDGTPVRLRLGNGSQIVRVRPGAGGWQAVQRLKALEHQGGPVAQEQASTFIRPPLFGFSPRLAVIATDRKKRSADQDMTHVLAKAATANIGTPLSPPVEENYVLGILDSGANAHIVAEPYATLLGLTDTHLTGTPFVAEGVGGTLIGALTYPIGLFVSGFDAIQPDGLLAVDRLVGHYNVSVLATPEINCGQGEVVTALIGGPLLAFYKSIIRIDQPREVVIDGEAFGSPDVQLVDSLDSATLSQFPRGIGMTYSGQLPPQTASYGWTLADDGPDFETPSTPSVLSYIALLAEGGLFLSNVGLLQGEPGPLNPLQIFPFIVDTGAQATLITPNTAANLNLDLFNPDFTVDVCGVGGLETGIPGFFVDYSRINAAGGALEYEHVPVVVRELPAVVSNLGGLLGMNYFWNRNIIFDVNPSTGTGFLRLSNPIPMVYGDFDYDFDVDEKDLGFLELCFSGPAILQPDPACTGFDADGDGDVDQDDFGVFQGCMSGSRVRAEPGCGPPR